MSSTQRSPRGIAQRVTGRVPGTAPGRRPAGPAAGTTCTRASGSKRRTAASATREVTRYRSTLGCTQSRCGVTSVQNTTWLMAGYRPASELTAEAPVANTEMARSAGCSSR